MKLLLLYALMLVLIGLGVYFFNAIRVGMLPGARRLRSHRKGKNNRSTAANQFDQWLLRIVPQPNIEWLENYIYQNGYAFTMTVSKLLQNMMLAALLGCLVSLGLIAIYFVLLNTNPILVLLAILIVPVYSFLILILMKSGRNSFVAKVLYQTPEFVDILTSELVNGSGNIGYALEKAQRDLEGDLQLIVRQAYQFYLQTHGNLDGTGRILKKYIQLPLYDQIVQVIMQFHFSGRAKKSLESIQKSCRIEINRIVRQQSMTRNLLIMVVAMGLLVNLSILIGLPVFSNIIKSISKLNF